MREPTTTVLVTALLGCAAATAGACGQRIGGTSPPRPLPVDRSMMCEHERVHARVPTRSGRTTLPAKGSPARTVLRAVCEQLDDMAACYGDAVWRDSGSTGLVTVRFHILEDGQVDEACFLDTAIDDREMLECIREQFLELELPQFDSKRHVVFPVVYVPSSNTTTRPSLPSLCERLRQEDGED